MKRCKHCGTINMDDSKKYCKNCANIFILAVHEINAYLTKKHGKLSKENEGEYTLDYTNLVYRFNANLDTFLHDLGINKKEFNAKIKKINGGKNAHS